MHFMLRQHFSPHIHSLATSSDVCGVNVKDNGTHKLKVSPWRLGYSENNSS